MHVLHALAWDVMGQSHGYCMHLLHDVMWQSRGCFMHLLHDVMWQSHGYCMHLLHGILSFEFVSDIPLLQLLCLEDAGHGKF